MTQQERPRRRVGGYVWRRYLLSIREKQHDVRKLAEEAIVAIELKQDHKAKALLHRVIILASQSAELCLEPIADLEPDDRSENL